MNGQRNPGRVRCSVALTLGAGLSSYFWSAQAGAEDPQPPESGFRAELLLDLGRLEQKLAGLAEALPESAFDWRPSDTVRTTGEVFLHVVTSNQRIVVALGIDSQEEPPATEETAGKEEVLASLKQSFKMVRNAVLMTPDSDLDAEVEFFGRSWSRRSLLYLVATHMHEHLGQTIVYARSQGVVPPWSQQGIEEIDN